MPTVIPLFLKIRCPKCKGNLYRDPRDKRVIACLQCGREVGSGRKH